MVEQRFPNPEEPITALKDDECWRLLATEQLGRLVVTADGDLDIFPVNYVVAAGAIYFRTGEGTKLVELTVNRRVLFEADHVDFESGYGWSVVIHGFARVLTSFTEMLEVDELGLRPWIPMEKHNVVAIAAHSVSGRGVWLGAARS